MASIPQILQHAKSVAVVGFSAKPDRASHWISDYLEEHGLRVYRINPVLDSTPERPISRCLADLPEAVDIVGIFRAPPHVPAIVDAAIAAKAKAVWMQPGAENPDAAVTAQDAGLDAVVGNCIYREHKAAFGIEDDRSKH
jgi:uncharacterized protein